MGLLALGLGVLPPCPPNFPAMPPTPTAATPEITIYVYGDYAHTNILVPSRTSVFQWPDHLEFQELGSTRVASYEYLGFGWGERELYRHLTPLEQIPFNQAWSALFSGKHPATLHVQGFQELPQAPMATFLIPLTLTPAQYQALNQFLLESFERNQQGEMIWLNVSRQRHSSFYAATGNYSVWNTCNSWTAQGLNAAQLPTPLFNGLAWPLFCQLSWYSLYRQVFPMPN